MGRSWRWGATGAAAATAATIAAVSLVTHPGPGTGADRRRDDVGTGPQLVTVYFVGPTAVGPRLFAERRQFGGRADVLAWSLANVVRGNAQDSDHGSAWPDRVSVTAARLRHGALVVDLRGPVVRRPPDLGRAEATIALQQVVRSAQSVSGSRLPVTFRHDGRAATSVLGVPTRRPLPRTPDDEALAPVSITSPVEQAAVTSPFRVRGRAAQGAVTWELRQGDEVVRRGDVAGRTSYAFSVRAPLGTYQLVVRDAAGSVDTKQVRVG